MHELSASLGCEPMSLYHHLKSRGDVLDAVAAFDGRNPSSRGGHLARPLARLCSFLPRSGSAPSTRVQLTDTRPVNRPEGFPMLESPSSLVHVRSRALIRRVRAEAANWLEAPGRTQIVAAFPGKARSRRKRQEKDSILTRPRCPHWEGRCTQRLKLQPPCARKSLASLY